MRARLATTDAMLVATVLLWSLNFTVTKYVLTHGFKPLAYSAVRYGLAVLVFGALTLALERSLRVEGARNWLLLGAATVVLTLNQICFVYALKFTTATTSALVLGSTPIFATLFAAVVGLERITSRIALAAAASFGGVALVAVGSEGGITRLSGDIKGVLLTLGMAATWAAYSVAITPLMRTYSPYRISSIVLVGTWVAVAAIGGHQLSTQDWELGWLVWLGLAYAVLGPLVLTNVLWFTSIARIGPPRASLFANLQPFTAAIFALLLLDESITTVQVAGGFAIAAGILLSRGPATPAPRGE
jgi:drug/metabolite transporter (DMT)-like permease